MILVSLFQNSIFRKNDLEMIKCEAVYRTPRCTLNAEIITIQSSGNPDT